MFTDSEESGSESEVATDDDLSYDDYYDDEEDESMQESDVDADDDIVSETNSETGDSMANDEYGDKVRALFILCQFEEIRANRFVIKHIHFNV